LRKSEFAERLQALIDAHDDAARTLRLAVESVKSSAVDAEGRVDDAPRAALDDVLAADREVLELLQTPKDGNTA
jgi:hypothetical protein